MMRILFAISIAGLLGACTAPDPNRRLSTNWIVQPREAPADPVVVTSGDLVMKQTLHPTGASQLGSDYQHGSGDDDFLPEGTLLYEVANPVSKVYCAMNLAKSGTLQKILSGPSTTQRCLVDSDGDGRFEGKFVARSPIEGVPLVNGQLPKELKPVEPPVAYTAVEPSVVGDTYWVGIRYDGKPLLYDRRNFSIDFGNDESDSGLTDWSYIKAEDMPAELSMMRSRFTVVSEGEDGLVIRIDRMMPPQPFSVVQTTTYTTY